MNEDIFSVLEQRGLYIPSGQRQQIAERIKDPATRKRFFDAYGNKAFKTFEEFDQAYTSQPVKQPVQQQPVQKNSFNAVKVSDRDIDQATGTPVKEQAMTKEQQKLAQAGANSFAATADRMLDRSQDAFNVKGPQFKDPYAHKPFEYQGETSDEWFGLNNIEDNWKPIIQDRTDRAIAEGMFADKNSAYYKEAERARRERMFNGVQAKAVEGTPFAMSDMRRAMMNVDTNHIASDDIGRKIKDIENSEDYKQRTAKENQADWSTLGTVNALTQLAPMPEGVKLGIAGAATAYNMAKNTDNVLRARQYYKEAQDILNRPTDSDNGFVSMLRGALDVAKDPDTFSAGLLDLGNNLDDKKLIDKLEKGEELTEDESLLLDAKITKARAELLRSNDTAMLYNAGTVAAESVGFMLDFIMTGGIASGAVKATTGRLTRGIMKHYAKKLAQKSGENISKGMVRGAGRLAEKSLLNQGAQMFGEQFIATGARMPFMATTYTGIGNAMSKQIDAEGKVTEGQTFGQALLDRTIEVWSEASGGTLGFVGKAVSAPLKPLFTKIPGIRNISRSALYKSLGKAISTSNNALEKAGWHGTASEMLEEVFGETARYLTGLSSDDDLRQFFTAENFETMLFGFLPMTIFGVGANVAGSINRYRKIKTGYNESKRDLHDILSENGLSEDEITGCMQSIQNATLDQLQQAATTIINNGKTFDQRKRIAAELQSYAGYASAMDCLVSKETKSEDQRKWKGQTLQNSIAEERNKMQVISQLTGNNAKLQPALEQWMQENDIESYNELQELDKESILYKDLVLTMDEAEQRQDIADRVNALSNNGQYITATLSDGTPVYVIAGNVNSNNANEQITVVAVKQEEGKYNTEMKNVSLSSIEEVSAQNSEDVINSIYEQQIAERDVQQMFKPGSYVTMTDDNGDAMDDSFKVVGMSQDGHNVVIEDANGQHTSIPATEFTKNFRTAFAEGDAVLQNEQGIWVIDEVNPETGVLTVSRYSTEGDKISTEKMSQQKLFDARAEMTAAGIVQPTLASQQVREDIRTKLYDSLVADMEKSKAESQSQDEPIAGVRYSIGDVINAADGNSYTVIEQNEDGTFNIQNNATNAISTGLTDANIENFKANGQAAVNKAAEKAEKAANKETKQPANIKQQIEEFKKEMRAKGMNDIAAQLDDLDLNNPQPTTVYEYAAQLVGDPKIKFDLDSVLRTGNVKQADLEATGLIKRCVKEGGVTLEELGETINEQAQSLGIAVDSQGTEGIEAVLEVIGSVSNAKEAKDFILQSRLDAAMRAAETAEGHREEYERQKNEAINNGTTDEAVTTLTRNVGTGNAIIYADQRIANAQKAVDDASNEAIEVTEDFSAYNNAIAQKNNRIAAAQAQLDRWNEIKEKLTAQQAEEKKNAPRKQAVNDIKNPLLNMKPVDAAAQMLTQSGSEETVKTYAEQMKKQAEKKAKAKITTEDQLKAVKTAEAEAKKWQDIIDAIPEAKKNVAAQMEADAKAKAEDDAVTESMARDYDAKAAAEIDAVNAKEEYERQDAEQALQNDAERQAQMLEDERQAELDEQARQEALEDDAKQQKQKKIDAVREKAKKESAKKLDSMKKEAVDQDVLAAGSMVKSVKNRIDKERQAAALKDVCDALGVKIEITDKINERASMNRAGVLKVNVNAKDPLTWIFGHELLHRLKNISDKKAYEKYKEAALKLIPGYREKALHIMNLYHNTGIERIMAENPGVTKAEAEEILVGKKKVKDEKGKVRSYSGYALNYEQALEEIVADKAGDLLRSGKLYKALEGNETVIGRIKDLIRQMIDKLQAAAGLRDSDRVTAINKLKDLYAEGKRKAAKGNPTNINDAISNDDDAARFSHATEEDLVKNITDFAESNEARRLNWSKKQIQDIVSETTDLINVIHSELVGDPNYAEFAKKQPTMQVDWRDGIEKPIVTWVRNNIEYKYDMSADTLCINNEGLETILASPVMADLMIHMAKYTAKDTSLKKEERGYTSTDYTRLYETLRDLGFVVPCKGCFDAAARLKMLPSTAQKFIALVNRTIDERNKDPKKFDDEVRKMGEGRDDNDINGLPTTAATKAKAIRIGVAGDNLTEHIDWTRLMSAEGQTSGLSQWPGIFRAWQRTGAGRPKDKLLPEPYAGHIMSNVSTIIAPYGEKTPSFRDLEVNQGTGLRRNSHSEFRPILAVDEIQFMRDAWMKNLCVFKYMKELDDVRLFGKMGVKFNMSAFAAFLSDGVAAGLDAKGNYAWAEESVGGREFPSVDENGKQHYDGAKGLEEAKKYVNKDCTLSSVAFSVPHLIKLMTDVPTHRDKSGIFGSLIPFHKSGATAEQLRRQGLGNPRCVSNLAFEEEAFERYNEGVTDFEKVQNDRFGKGWKVVAGKRAGTKVVYGHKIEFANGTIYRNDELGITLYSSADRCKDNGGKAFKGVSGPIFTIDSENNEIAHSLDVSYNDKVREIGGKTPYKDAADYYIKLLRGNGFLPRFDFDVPEDKFLEMCKAANVDPHHPKLGWKGTGNSWSPCDADSYYSLFCDYGMIDSATGEYAPHRPVLEGQKNADAFEKALPKDYIDVIKKGVERYSGRKAQEDSKVNEAIIEYCKRSVDEGKMNQEEVDKILEKHGISNERYSISDKSLIGVHNISAEKLSSAIKMGGLANPSTAVVDINKHLHDEFGEISLVMPSSLVDKNTGRNAGTWTDDVYTPTYPAGRTILTDKGKASYDKFIDSLTDNKEVADYYKYVLQSDLKVGNPVRIQWAFLKSEKGIDTATKYVGVDTSVQWAIQKYKTFDNFMKHIDKNKNLKNLWTAEAERQADDKLRKEDPEAFSIFGGPAAFKANKARRDAVMSKYYDDEKNLRPEVQRQLFEEAKNKMTKAKGQFNSTDTDRYANDVVYINGWEDEYQKWIKDKIDEFGASHELLAGADRSGNKRYIPETLENASSIMNDESLTGNGYGGWGSFIAEFAEEIPTLEDMRANRDRLGTSENNKTIREDFSHMVGIIDDYNDKVGLWDGSASKALAKLVKNRDKFNTYVKKVAPGISDEEKQTLKEYCDLFDDFKADYFETKFDRPVYFNEFAAAVVPKDLDASLKDALKQQGLNVVDYNPNKEGSRKKAIDKATKGEGIRFSIASDIFYSNATRAVQDIKQEKATPEQWLAMLTKNGGLKAEEDKWIGISDFLKSKNGSVTKQEILDYIAENDFKIEEVGYYDPSTNETEYKVTDKDIKTAEKYAEDQLRKEDVIKYWFKGLDMSIVDGKIVISEEQMPIVSERYAGRTYKSKAVTDKWAKSCLKKAQDKFDYYKNLMLDSIKAVGARPSGFGNVINETRQKYITGGLKNNQEIALTVPSVEPYHGSLPEVHFDDENTKGKTVAWCRFGETTDSEGNRVLVLDEVQSQRHQDGREKGYKDNKAIAEAKRRADESEKAVNDYVSMVASKYNLQGQDVANWSSYATDEEIDEYNKLYDAFINESDYNKYKFGNVPDAPFRKNWHELVMKRMLRFAADNGFDKIAWTKGKQQAERYKLGNSINGINVGAEKSNGNRYVDLLGFGDDGSYGMLINKEGKVIDDNWDKFVGQNISDVVGKELASQIMNDSNSHNIDLQNEYIGGEGMKGFYDNMLPKFMDKYCKKWGTKTSEVTLPNVEEAGRTMWAVDVTPEMKESVQQGQTRFSIEDTDSEGRKREAQKEIDDMTSLIDAVKKAKTPTAVAKAQKAMLDKARKIEDAHDCERYSIIGQIGAKNLDLAEECTTRIDNLHVAEQMEQEGREARTIKLATGWERAKDKKWRYEMPDGKPKKNWKKAKTVGDFWDDNNLFEAYPALRAKLVEFVDFGDSIYGEYDGNTLRLNKDFLESDTIKGINIKSAVVHELQHAVQTAEHFDNGTALGGLAKMTDVSMIAERQAKEELGISSRRDYFDFDDATGILEYVGADESIVNKLKFPGYENTEAVNAFNENEHNIMNGNKPLLTAKEITSIRNGITDEKKLKLFDSLMPKFEKYISMLQRTEEIADELADKPDSFFYKNNSGEVEARNVQKRLNMTDEERRNTLLSDTEDVERNEQIVRYSINGSSELAYKIPDASNGTNFIDLILTGKKKGETRKVGRYLKTGEWRGIYKDGKVYGRVKFGEPIEITKESPEYKDAYIEGTNYDIEDGGSKWYYPITEYEKFDEPKSVVGTPNQSGARYSIDPGYLSEIDKNGIATDETRVDDMYDEGEPERNQRKVYYPKYVVKSWTSENGNPIEDEYNSREEAEKAMSDFQYWNDVEDDYFAPSVTLSVKFTPTWVDENNEVIEEEETQSMSQINDVDWDETPFRGDDEIGGNGWEPKIKSIEKYENEVTSAIEKGIAKDGYTLDGKNVSIEMPSRISKYNKLKVIDEEGEEMGVIQLRIADHSYNPQNNDTGARDGNFISLVLTDNDKTQDKFHGQYNIRHNIGDDINEVVSDVQNRIDEIIEEWNSDEDRERFSISDTDSEGNKLSQEQQEYFKDSKVVDEKGKLKPVYHAGSFTLDENYIPRGGMHFGTLQAAIDRAKDKIYEDLLETPYGQEIAKGKYCWMISDVNNETLADEFASKENISKAVEIAKGMPEYFNTRKEAKAAADKIFFALHPDCKEIIDAMERGENPKPNDYDITLTKAYLNIKNMQRSKDAGIDWNGVELKDGFDGIIYTNEYEDKGNDSYIIFNPNQAKLVSNENPTENSDVRYSVEDEQEPKSIKDKLVKSISDFVKDVKPEDTSLDEITKKAFAVANMTDAESIKARKAIDQMLSQHGDIDVKENIEALTSLAQAMLQYKGMDQASVYMTQAVLNKLKDTPNMTKLKVIERMREIYDIIAPRQEQAARKTFEHLRKTKVVKVGDNMIAQGKVVDFRTGQLLRYFNESIESKDEHIAEKRAARLKEIDNELNDEKKQLSKERREDLEAEHDAIELAQRFADTVGALESNMAELGRQKQMIDAEVADLVGQITGLKNEQKRLIAQFGYKNALQTDEYATLAHQIKELQDKKRRAMMSPSVSEELKKQLEDNMSKIKECEKKRDEARTDAEGNTWSHQIYVLRQERTNLLKKRKAVKEHVLEQYKAIDEMMRKSKSDLIEAFDEISAELSGMIAEGKTAYKERQKRIREHKKQVLHYAFSDLQGVAKKGNEKEKKNFFTEAYDFFANPTRTFMTEIKKWAQHAPNGEGYLYDHFGRGFIDARHKMLTGMEDAISKMNGISQKLFKADYERVVIESKKPFGIHLVYNIDIESGNADELDLSIGQAMMIYMWNKETDGEVKLRQMGISEEVMEELTGRLDELAEGKWRELADYIQQDFLPAARERYNETYISQFGTSMAHIDNYFPLKIHSGERSTGAAQPLDPDAAAGMEFGMFVTTTVGSIKSRTYNKLGLDIANFDALDILNKHVEDMEWWNAMSPLANDVNTLLANPTFCAKIDKLSEGSSRRLSQDLAKILIGKYSDKQNGEQQIVSLMKYAQRAKIGFRPWTALKQLASFPAFAADSDINPAKLVAHVAGYSMLQKESDRQWAMKNLPMFRERCNSALAGNVSLQSSNVNNGKFNRAVDKMTKAGMYLNKLIDTYTCAAGARLKYEGAKKRYLKYGLSEEQAERRAIQDAEILYNESQQSSEGLFVSQMQKSKAFMPNMLSAFQNSQMGYTRKVIEGVRQLKKSGFFDKQKRQEMKDFSQKKWAREFGWQELPDITDDMTDEQKQQIEMQQIINVDAMEKAAKIVDKEMYRQYYNAVANITVYGYVIGAVWKLMSVSPQILLAYLPGGDDDDKKLANDKAVDAMLGGFDSSIQGFAGGQIMDAVYSAALEYERHGKDFDIEKALGSAQNLFVADMTKEIKGMMNAYGSDDIALLCTHLANALTEMGTGFDVNTLANMVRGCIELKHDLGGNASAQDITLDISRILCAPNSQLEAIGLAPKSKEEVSSGEWFKRYCEWKRKNKYGIFYPAAGEMTAEEQKKLGSSARKFITERNEQLNKINNR